MTDQIIGFWLHIEDHADFDLLSDSLMSSRLTP
jgi:hypothetical protein